MRALEKESVQQDVEIMGALAESFRLHEKVDAGIIAENIARRMLRYSVSGLYPGATDAACEDVELVRELAFEAGFATLESASFEAERIAWNLLTLATRGVYPHEDLVRVDVQF